MKFPKIVVPIVVIGTIGMASFAAPSFSYIEKTPEIKGSIFYSMKNTPSGFSLVSGYNNSDLSELTGKQNPNPIRNSTGTCTFSPQISYLPETDASRGDKYLTLSYIYENAQISPNLPTAVKKDHVSAGNTFLEVLTSSYDVPDSTDNGKSKKGYYRTIAVRAMDRTVPIPYATGSDSKGLPTVVMTYDCQTVDDYKDSDFSALLSSVKVNLTDTISNAEPKNDTVNPTQSASPTDSPTAPESPPERPSTSSEDSSTASPTGR
jgi:hypothetical protein